MKPKTKKRDLVFSTGDDSLATLGEELRRKFPELVEKMEKFKTSSDQAIGKMVDTLLELFPYEWHDRKQVSQGVMFCVRGNYLGALGAVIVQTKQYILQNGFGKYARLLKHHAHLFPQFVYVHFGLVDFLAQNPYLTLDLETWYVVVHSTQRAKQCGLAAAGGTQQSRDRIFSEGTGDVLKHGLVRITHAHLIQVDGHRSDSIGKRVRINKVADIKINTRVNRTNPAPQALVKACGLTAS